MAEIWVSDAGEAAFDVEVVDGTTTTSHRVTIPPAFKADHGIDAAPDEVVVEESFRFLLEREPATSILGRFALDEITRYFPEYPEEITARLTR